MFPRKCVDYETCSCACSRIKRRLCVLFWLTKTCLCVTVNICQHVCHNRNDVQLHDITYEPFSVSNFSRTKSCLRTSVWATRRTVCEKTSLYATFLLTWTRPHALFLISGRVCIQRVTLLYLLVLDRHVSTRYLDYQTCSCACSSTRKTYVCTLFELERHVYA